MLSPGDVVAVDDFDRRMLPEASGVYLFWDLVSSSSPKLLYVGKALQLPVRLGSYFLKSADAKQKLIVARASHVEWLVSLSEAEALLLEEELISRHSPLFNVRLKFASPRPGVLVSSSVKIPSGLRVASSRFVPPVDALSFGPFENVSSRNVVSRVAKLSGVRDCSSATFSRHVKLGRPCLSGSLGICSQPCVLNLDDIGYAERVELASSLLRGPSDVLCNVWRSEMKDAAACKEFERAGVLRDLLKFAVDVKPKLFLKGPVASDCDVFCWLNVSGVYALSVVSVRDSRVSNVFNASVNALPDDFQAAALLLVEDFYRHRDVPSLVALSVPDVFVVPGSSSQFDVARPVVFDVAPVGKFLNSFSVSRVSVRVPRRGELRRLSRLGWVNAFSVASRLGQSFSHDAQFRASAARDLGVLLKLASPPLRIECFDVSHLSGSFTSGSLVVAVDGLIVRSQQRHFGFDDLFDESGRVVSNDVESMFRLVSRRLARFSLESVKSVSVRDASFSQFPDLIVVDGGPAQVASAVSAAVNTGFANVPIVGLAKRFEELWVPEATVPLVIDSPHALWLMRLVRDEAHRVANMVRLASQDGVVVPRSSCR